MKVLFLNYEYPPLGAGAANATAYLMKEFSRISDLEVVLVTSSVDEKYHLEKIGENIKIHRLPIGKNNSNLHFQSQKDLLVYSWKAFWFGKKLIRKSYQEKKRYDLTHSFFTVPCGFLSLYFKLHCKVPFIVSLRGSDVPGYSDRFSFLYKFLTPLIRFIWKKSLAVVANSQGLRNLALKTNPKQNIEIIYNGIDINDFAPNSNLRPSDKFIITNGASRITARKGYRYVIKALEKLIPKYPNLYFRPMGDGNEKEELEQLVKNLKLEKNIEFLGRIPREKTTPYYQEASVFIMSSLNEGMSNAMLEALGTGLPIISTPTGGADELVKDGENGFIIKMKDSDDIREKLEKLINDPELCRRMGEKSRQIAENMSWEKVAEDYFNLYKEISNSP